MNTVKWLFASRFLKGKRGDERGENRQNWVYCKDCCKWFHFEFDRIERVLDRPYFCGCKTKQLDPL